MTYAKFALALVATVVSAALAAMTGDGVIDPQEWVNIAILGVGAFGVGYVPNALNGPVAKSVVAVLSAVLTVAATFILSGIDTTAILQMVLAGIAALGVYAIPNTSRATSVEG